MVSTKKTSGHHAVHSNEVHPALAHGGSTYANINGATDTSYTTPVVGLADNGKLFRAVASNVVGTVTSHPAKLDVLNIGFGGLAYGLVVRPNGDLVASVDECLTVSYCSSSYGTYFMGLRVLTPAGKVYSWVGNSTGRDGDVDGAGSAAAFRYPRALAQDEAGNLYVADFGNRIRKITPAGEVSTLAGGDASGGFVNGTGALASFNFFGSYAAVSMAMDPDSNLYVLETSNHAIRKVTPTGVVSTLAGGAFGSNDGAGTAAQFTGNESGLAYDPVGKRLIVSDRAYLTIRAVSLSGVVTTLYSGDKLVSAGFKYANGVALDGSGNIFVLDGYQLRKFTPAGNISSVATIGVGIGFGSGYTPTAITTDGSGNVYALFGASNSFVLSGQTSGFYPYSYLVQKFAPDGTVTTLP